MLTVHKFADGYCAEQKGTKCTFLREGRTGTVAQATEAGRVLALAIAPKHRPQ